MNNIIYYMYENAITIILHTTTKSIRIEGGVRERRHHLRFADDIVLISDNLKEVREMLEELQATQKTGQKINYNKTKITTNLEPIANLGRPRLLLNISFFYHEI